MLILFYIYKNKLESFLIEYVQYFYIYKNKLESFILEYVHIFLYLQK